MPDSVTEPSLNKHAHRLLASSVAALFAADPKRHEQLSCRTETLMLDYSKQLLDYEVLGELLDLAGHHKLGAAFFELVSGAQMNVTEARPALHTLLRGTARSENPDFVAAVDACLDKMQSLVRAIHAGERCGHRGDRFTDVVNIGIGGSDLGPRMVCRALEQRDQPLNAHFIANVDPNDLDTVLAPLNPDTTLVIVCSKSFTTEETLTNALRARSWLASAGVAECDIHNHVIAVTTNLEAASHFGIDRDQCYPLWDWVGGRYSLWSAIGLVIALQSGWTAFEQLLEGARQLDECTLSAAPIDNLPMLMALLEYWNTLYLHRDTHVVLPYSQRLEHLTACLQQLTMESNGKRVKESGEPAPQRTAPVLWGSAGTIGQHSYYQLLHQGMRQFSADFIITLKEPGSDSDAQRKLVANALAQSRTLMLGRSDEEAQQLAISRGQPKAMTGHYAMPGNHPHSLLIMDSVNPKSLGALVAAYEHKTFFLSKLLGINAFDQWGVELGKQIGQQINQMLIDGQGLDDLDPATAATVTAWRDANA
ncbi:glucose-6-phosphate isomerase [Luminiphilus syltensis NOR5-1B]|uniref:Glucose-6-phosphate isomerase n=1 Tax=Luminiphilus syltensis NOR5-1B TaxID=565045 RepID=B8KWK1_9GAMM|nr:glucose-6-phosphate isomerase [Luminiphilus syltensis]EED34236.1 glucose-6-phosphate isomerase [Luminiphilus syltensis NOR5-1B]